MSRFYKESSPGTDESAIQNELTSLQAELVDVLDWDTLFFSARNEAKQSCFASFLAGLFYLPGKKASKLLAAGLASSSSTCEANVITISAAVVKAIADVNPTGIVR